MNSVSTTSRLLIVMPNWLGDAVMATPLLRLFRELLPDAHIAALANPLVAPVLGGLPFINETRIAPKHDPSTRRWLKSQKFDTAILLPNSFRSAWMIYRAGIPRRLGYARDYRGFLLTHKLRPQKKTTHQRTSDKAKRTAILTLSKGPVRQVPSIAGYQPTPAINYYLALAELLKPGCHAQFADPCRMTLAITEEDRAQAAAALLSRDVPEKRPLVIMVPGANFGSSKCWPPENFAQIARRLVDPAGPFDATVLIASSPAEIPLVNAIMEYATAQARNVIPEDRLVALAALNNAQGLPLGALKELTRRAALMVCNDTGPRHFAAAFNIPTVTLFGPTDPRWAETFSKTERIIQLPVPCGPCQLKRCPIDHRCMTGITPEMVLTQITALWSAHHPSLITQDSE